MGRVIVIHGAPGCGKTTISARLHECLGAPWFEFGWIPEFRRLNPHTEISCADEEALSFESLVLVVKNYLRHGFTNVILSDLNDIRILDAAAEFEDYVIITLYADDETLIKERILTRDNGNEFRDWESAIKVNRIIKARKPLPNEYRICLDGRSTDVLAELALKTVENHKSTASYDSSEFDRDDYYSYTNE